MRVKVVLGVDPGHTTGWCLTSEKGVVLDKDQTKGNNESSDYLTDLFVRFPEYNYEFTAIVMEDYKIFAHKAKQHIGSRVPAAQIIGIVEHEARQRDIKLVKQPSSILVTAQKLTNVKMPSDHSKSHWVSAFLHAAHYLIKEGKMLTAAQQRAIAE